MRKLIKITIYLVIFIMLLFLSLGTIITFNPHLIEEPIKEQLEIFSGLDVDLSNINIDIDTQGLFFYAKNVKFSSKNDKKISSINGFKLRIELYDLMNSIYSPRAVNIDNLIIYTAGLFVGNANDSDAINTYQSTINNIEIDYLPKLLTIDKTIVKGKQDFIIESVTISKEDSYLQFKVLQQPLDFGDFYSATGKVDIEAKIPLKKNADNNVSLPIIINHNDFVSTADIKLFKRGNDNIIQLIGKIDKIKVDKIVDFIPKQILTDNSYKWLKNAFISGDADSAKLIISKNLSNTTPIKTTFSANFANASILLTKELPKLKNISAKLDIVDTKLLVTANKAIFHNMKLNDVKVQIKDMSKKKIVVDVYTKVNTKSEKITKFLSSLPLTLTPKISKLLSSFNLSGKVNGHMNLAIPLYDDKYKLSFTANIKNNNLTTLNDAISVKNINSSIFYKNGSINSTGTGSINNVLFDININPKRYLKEQDNYWSLELLNKDRELSVYIANKIDESWKVDIDSPEIKANVFIFHDKDRSIRVDVKNMHVQTTSSKLKNNWNISPVDIPNMHIRYIDAKFNNYKAPNFNVDVVSKGDTVHASLYFEDTWINKYFLNFEGDWLNNSTNFIIKAKGKKLASFFKKLNISESIVGDTFSFDASISCKCSPWEAGLKNIFGTLDVNLKQGSFLNENYKFSKLLSFLNIKSIINAATPDVDSLSSKGFNYDSVVSQLYLQDSLLKIRNFKIDSNLAVINLNGYSDVFKREYNFQAHITPAIADSVPIATYLAGGGIYGLGTWIIDKLLFKGEMLRSITDNMAAFKYKITGTWDEPIIIEE